MSIVLNPSLSLPKPCVCLQLFLNYLKSANGATGRIAGGTTAAYTGLPPVIAPFSSRGPDIYFGLDQPSATDQPIADVLKPTIVAPGVDIWSSWSPLPSTGKDIFRGEKFCMISGTSMSTPHMAGVAALVRQAHPDWSPSIVASALATTAIPLDSLDNPLNAYDDQLDQYGQLVKRIKRPGNAFDFGGGFVDAASAFDPGLIFNASEYLMHNHSSRDFLLSPCSVFVSHICILLKVGTHFMDT